MTQRSTSPVLIIGAGIAGLVLAQGLQHRGIPYELYERDGAESRGQGYRIRLNLVGLNGLRDILPRQVYDEIKPTCAEWNPGLRLYKHTGEPMTPFLATLPTGAPGESRPTNDKPPPPGIDLDDELTRRAMSSRLPAEREVLRSVLLRGLDPAHVHFDKSFDKANITDSGVTAAFEDGFSSPLGSILVGADGASSRVASTLIGDLIKPKPIGAKVIYGRSPLTPMLEKDLLSGIDRGLHVGIGPGGVSLFVEVMRFDHPASPDNYVFWVLTDPSGFKDLSADVALSSLHGTVEVQRLSQKALEGWHEGLRCIVEQQDPTKSGIWAVVASAPEIPVWPTNRRVTFLGDAVHAVSPNGGQGGNMAIRSVQTLLDVLVNERDGDGWSEASISGWEHRMRQDAQKQSMLSREAAGPTARFPMPLWGPVVWDMAKEMMEI